MAKTVVIFDSAKLALMTGGLNLSDTYRCALLTAAWTPSIDISDFGNSISSFANPNASGGDAVRVVNPPGGGALGDQFTKTADGVLKFDLSDVAFTASTGLNICAQYGVIYASGATVPLAYWELSTGEVVASQINVQWPAAGIFETSDNA
jgi:hypothetical protein